jgi:hypothetical protein
MFRQGVFVVFPIDSVDTTCQNTCAIRFIPVDNTATLLSELAKTAKQKRPLNRVMGIFCRLSSLWICAQLANDSGDIR